MTTKTKILIGVLGVLVFAGAVFGAYKLGQRQVKPGPRPTPTPAAVATPTPDPTLGWKTFTSTEMKFSMRYPNQWFTHQTRKVFTDRWETVWSYPVDNPSPQSPLEGQKAYITIDYVSKTSETLEENAQKIISGEFFPFGKSPKKNYITVGGETALVVEDWESSNPHKMVLVNHDGRYYIHWGAVAGEKENFQSYKNIFNLMLSTFRFLE